MHHFMNEQAMNDVLGSLGINLLITIDRLESIPFHPFRNVVMPPSGSVPDATDAFDEMQIVSFRNQLLPPAGRSDIDHAISHVAEQIFFLCVSLEDFVPISCCNHNQELCFLCFQGLRVKICLLDLFSFNF